MKKLGNKFKMLVLTILTLSLANISNVNAQEIKRKTQNKYEIDSLGLKTFSELVLKVESIPNLYKSHKKILKEKDSTISLLNYKIDEGKKREDSYKLSLATMELKFDLEREKYKSEIKHLKWQRTKIYIVGGVVVTISIVLLVASAG